MKLGELVSSYVKTCQSALGYRVEAPPLGEGREVVEPEALARMLRDVGVPVQAYRLVHARELGFAHLRWADGRWELHLPPLHPSPTPLGTQVIVGEPPTGVWFQVVSETKGRSENEQPDVVIAYAATSDLPEVDPQVFTELEACIRSARGSGRRVVYLDSLGLIPEESVKAMNPRDERAAFELAYRLIAHEAEQIGAGHPPHETRSPFWKALYELLAQLRVETKLEALSYDLWKKIVEFDRHNLLQQAIQEFLRGFPEEAAKTSLEYAQGFHKLNCTARARLVVDQVERLMKSSGPRPLVLIVRELGHYGVLERLLASRYVVHSKIVGEDRFTSLLGAPGLGEGLLDNLEVKLAREEELLWAARACLKRILLTQLEEKGFREKVGFFARTGIDELNWDDLKELVEQLYEPVLLMQRKHGISFPDQLIALLTSRGVIPESPVPTGGEAGDR